MGKRHMVEDHSASCLYAMLVLLVLNLVISIWDRQVQDKILYVINAVLAGVEVITYLILKSLPLGWGADHPYLGFLPFLWLGSVIGIMLMSYFCLWDFFDAHRKTWWGKTGMILLILAHIAIIAVGLFILFGALYSLKWG